MYDVWSVSNADSEMGANSRPSYVSRIRLGGPVRGSAVRSRATRGLCTPKAILARVGRAFARPVHHHRQDPPPLHQHPAVIERMLADYGAYPTVFITWSFIPIVGLVDNQNKYTLRLLFRKIIYPIGEALNPGRGIIHRCRALGERVMSSGHDDIQ